MKFNEIEYKRPDFSNILKDLDKSLEKMEEAKNAEDFFKAYDEFSKINDEVFEHYTLAYIRNSIDTRDEFYEKEVEEFDKVLPEFSKANNKMQNIRLESQFRKDFEEKYGKNLTKIDELQKDIFKPEIMEDRVKESKLTQEYQKLMGTAKFEFDGKTFNISQITPYLQDKDRNIRIKANKAITKWLESHQEEFDKIYDELVKVRTSIANKLGFDSYIDVAYRSFARTDWDRNDAKKYREQIVKYIVPLAQKYYKEQAERIGIENMMDYDLGLRFLSGNPTPKYNEEEMVKSAQIMYNELSPETGEFFNTMVNNEMMHLTSQDGKAPGGYMTQLPITKLPFIFANFNGTSHDTQVLTHEAGHAFQGYIARNYPRELQEACMEIMETHSMSMEFFTHPWMDKFFKEDTEKYYYFHVVDSIQFLPYGASIDEFQEWVYDNPQATPKERNTKFREIQKKYNPEIVYEEGSYLDEGRRWQIQTHVYSSPFYYLDYTIAQINAFQFFVMDRENHENAWNKYLELCKLAGKYGTQETIKKVGLKNPFDAETYEYIVPKLEEYIDGLDYSKIK